MNDFTQGENSPSIERLGHPVDRDADRTHQASQLLIFSESTGLHTTLSASKTASERYSSLCETSNKDILGMLTRINGILRNKPTSDRGYTQQFQYIGAGNQLDGVDYVPPHSKDKGDLMNDLINSMRKVDDPHTAAALLGFGINSIHPFEDGNGRVSRLAYRSIAHGISEHDSTFPAIIEWSGEDVSNTNGEIFKNAIFETMRQESPDFIELTHEGKTMLVPVTMPMLFDGTIHPLSNAAPSGSDARENRNNMFTATLEQNMLEFLCIGIAKAVKTGSIKDPKRDILTTIKGYDCVQIDNFIRNADDEGIEEGLEIANQISTSYVRRLTKELLTPHEDQMDIGLDTVDHGPRVVKFGEACSMVADRVFDLRKR